MSAQGPAWELSKENVAPLARGRDKSSLDIALHASKDDLASARAAHESAVRRAIAGDGPHANDPLAPMTSLVKWAADAYQPRAPQLLSVLETSCRTFAKEKRYKNDPRYVRLWVRYADARDDPMDCFNYMRAHGIGDRTALFYEAWASTLEYKRDFPAADTAYSMGLEQNAQPRERLEQRQREFLSRMVARDRRAEAKAAKANARSGSQNALKSSTSTSLHAPILKQQPLSDENARPALGTLTTKQATSGQRPFAPLQDSIYGVYSSSRPSSRRNADRGHSPYPGGAETRGKAKGNTDSSFKMYSDHEVNAEIREGVPSESSASNRDTQSVEFPSLAKFDEVRKENEGNLPSQWAGATMPQDSPLERSRQRSRRIQAPSFQIFADSAEANATEKQKQQQRTTTTDEGVEDSTRNRSSIGPHSGPPSPTINTRIAMQQVDEMFNSPLPFEVHHSASEKARPRERIEIYHDISDDRDSTSKSSHSASVNSGLPQEDKENLAGPRNAKPRGLFEPGMESKVLQPRSDPLSGITLQASVPSIPSDENGSHRARTFKSSTESMTDWCVDCVPDLPGWRPLDSNCPELSDGVVVTLQSGADDSQSYIVESLLGVGFEGASRVYAATPLDGVENMDDGVDDDEETTVAIKVASTVNLAWEFYIYNIIHSRLDHQGVPNIPHALFFYHGSPHSCLILDRVSITTLSNLMDISPGNCMDESVVMFLVIDLMKAVESLHEAGVIHNDITLENIVLRKDGAKSWTGDYSRDGKNGWGGKGVALIDFNHAVDTHHSAVGGQTAEDIVSHASFMGNSHWDRSYDMHLDDEGGSRELVKWSFNIDCMAVAACTERLLRGDGSKNLVRHKAWKEVLTRLHGVEELSLKDTTTRTLRECRHALEDVLSNDNSLGSALRAQLKRLFIAANEARQTNDMTKG